MPLAIDTFFCDKAAKSDIKVKKTRIKARLEKMIFVAIVPLQQI